MFICYSRILKKKNVYKPGVQKTQVKLLILKKGNKNKPKLSSSSFRLYQKKKWLQHGKSISPFSSQNLK